MPRFGLALVALSASIFLVGPARLAMAQEFEAPPIPSTIEEPSGLTTQSPEYYGGQPVDPPAYEEVPAAEYEIYDPNQMETAATCPGVCWTIQTDAIFLRRTDKAVLPLANGATPYGGQNLDVPFRFGPRISFIGRNIANTPWEAEFTYFSVDGWLAQQASAGATTFFTTPNINFGARTVTTTYREALYSTEFNVRRRIWDSVTLISGVRMLEVRNNMFTDLVGASHQINVNNHLYGYQLGADGRLLAWNNFDLNTWAKAGIYGNAADQATEIVGVGGAVPNYGARGGRAAFVGELAVVGTYHWNDWISARAGYQVIVLDGLAIAAEQVPFSNVATGVATLDTSKTLNYHGGFMGLEMNW